MKSLKKTMTKAASKAMAGVGMTSGVAAAPADARAGWEDFSDFSNAVPIGGGASLGARAVPLHDGLGAETEPHPLTKDWAARIKNPKVRAAFVKRPLESYADAHALNVWTGTWNTNGKPPPASLDISAWLDVASSPDLVVVGFQEIVPLTPGKVLMQEDAQATGEWEAIIERCLNGAAGKLAPAPPEPAGAADGWTAFGTESSRNAPPSKKSEETNTRAPKKYARVARKQLVGVYITVWATRAVSRHVSDVRVAAVATGVNLGVAMLGNKGGAAVWLKVHNTPLCFVCAHLSAGSKETDAQKRSEDYREIYAKLSFPAPPAASSDGSFEKPASVADAFAAVWIGDLNYRLNLADDHVRGRLSAIATAEAGSESSKTAREDFRVRSAYAAERARRYASLLGADQLSLERAAGKAFAGWTEAPVAFAPTYKYRPGTHTYSGAGDADEPGDGSEQPTAPAVNAKEEKKKRTPAWCDRVLWRGRDVSQTSYGSTRALTQSDHKPVFSAFVVTAQRLCPRKLSAVLEETRRELDAREMASQPRCAVLNPRAVFEDSIPYAEPRATSFRLVNTGDAPASWNFVAAVPGEAAVAPPWLRVAPARGHLLPGEETLITATATVAGGGAAGPAALAGAAGLGAEASDADAPALRVSSGASVSDGPAFSETRADPAAALAPAATTAGSIAEAARLAQARAVSAGIARVEAGGGVSMVSPASKTREALAGARRGSAPDPLGLSPFAAAAGGEEGAFTHAVSDATAGGDAALGLLSALDGDASSLAELNETGDIPVDAILVLHLDRGRDFFLTVAGTVRASVFGKPLWQLPTASFPPNVPRPIGALVDFLFSVSVSETEGMFHSPSRGTLAGLAAIRRALDDGADVDAAPGADAAEAAHALLALFASLPRPLFAATRACLAAVDGAMAPWAQAAAQAARAAAAARAPWTLATERLARLAPSAAAAEALLAAHLRPAERAATSHTVSFLRGMFQAWYEAHDARVQSAPHGASASVFSPNAFAPNEAPSNAPRTKNVARVVSQFAEVWFPPAGAPDAAAKRMGRLAFVGALCGAAPGALDGFNPMDVLFDVTLGTGTGTGTETTASGASGTGVPGAAARAPAEPPVPAELAGIGSGGPGLTGNLIDF